MLKLPRILIAITSLALSSCTDLYCNSAYSEFEYYSDISHGIQYFVENPKKLEITILVGEFPHYKITMVYGGLTDLIPVAECLKDLSYRRQDITDDEKAQMTDMIISVKDPFAIAFYFSPSLNWLYYYVSTGSKYPWDLSYSDFYAIDPDEGKKLKDIVWDIAMKPEESSGESDPGTEETTDSSSAESIDETSADDAGDPQ